MSEDSSCKNIWTVSLSFKRFRIQSKNMKNGRFLYKDLRLPMMGYTVAINSVFAILIAAVLSAGRVKNGTVDLSFIKPVILYYYHPDHYRYIDKDDVCR